MNKIEFTPDELLGVLMLCFEAGFVSARARDGSKWTNKKQRIIDRFSDLYDRTLKLKQSD